eukprot:Clim_evm28s243 gene=Clim_evmTU28s243
MVGTTEPADMALTPAQVKHLWTMCETANTNGAGNTAPEIDIKEWPPALSISIYDDGIAFDGPDEPEEYESDSRRSRKRSIHPWLPSMEGFLSDIARGYIPHGLVSLLRHLDPPPRYRNGKLRFQIINYGDMHGEPTKSIIELRPSNLSTSSDVAEFVYEENQSNGMRKGAILDANEVEAQVVNAMAGPLCLSPDPMVAMVDNWMAHNSEAIGFRISSSLDSQSIPTFSHLMKWCDDFGNMSLGQDPEEGRASSAIGVRKVLRKMRRKTAESSPSGSLVPLTQLNKPSYQDRVKILNAKEEKTTPTWPKGIKVIQPKPDPKLENGSAERESGLPTRASVRQERYMLPTDPEQFIEIRAHPDLPEGAWIVRLFAGTGDTDVLLTKFTSMSADDGKEKVSKIVDEDEHVLFDNSTLYDLDPDVDELVENENERLPYYIPSKPVEKTDASKEESTKDATEEKTKGKSSMNIGSPATSVKSNVTDASATAAAAAAAAVVSSSSRKEAEDRRRQLVQNSARVRVASEQAVDALFAEVRRQSRRQGLKMVLGSVKKPDEARSPSVASDADTPISPRSKQLPTVAGTVSKKRNGKEPLSVRRLSESSVGSVSKKSKGIAPSKLSAQAKNKATSHSTPIVPDKGKASAGKMAKTNSIQAKAPASRADSQTGKGKNGPKHDKRAQAAAAAAAVAAAANKDAANDIKSHAKERAKGKKGKEGPDYDAANAAVMAALAMQSAAAQQSTTTTSPRNSKTSAGQFAPSSRRSSEAKAPLGEEQLARIAATKARNREKMAKINIASVASLVKTDGNGKHVGPVRRSPQQIAGHSAPASKRGLDATQLNQLQALQNQLASGQLHRQQQQRTPFADGAGSLRTTSQATLTSTAAVAPRTSATPTASTSSATNVRSTVVKQGDVSSSAAMYRRASQQQSLGQVPQQGVSSNTTTQQQQRLQAQRRALKQYMVHRMRQLGKTSLTPVEQRKLFNEFQVLQKRRIEQIRQKQMLARQQQQQLQQRPTGSAVSSSASVGQPTLTYQQRLLLQQKQRQQQQQQQQQQQRQRQVQAQVQQRMALDGNGDLSDLSSILQRGASSSASDALSNILGGIGSSSQSQPLTSPVFGNAGSMPGSLGGMGASDDLLSSVLGTGNASSGGSNSLGLDGNNGNASLPFNTLNNNGPQQGMDMNNLSSSEIEKFFKDISR